MTSEPKCIVHKLTGDEVALAVCEYITRQSNGALKPKPAEIMFVPLPGQPSPVVKAWYKELV